MLAYDARACGPTPSCAAALRRPPDTFSLEVSCLGRVPDRTAAPRRSIEYGHYIGQDPDPFIRLQLRRDPATGSYELMR